MRRAAVAGGVVGGAVVAYATVGRAWHLRWGADDQEVVAPLPGDDLLPAADLVATRAIAIDAASAAVWPWLAQLGQERGGLYSYERLENLAGCDIHNADSVVAEWQTIEVGDEVRLHPAVPLRVAVVEAGRALVLQGGAPEGAPPAPYDFTWSFVLEDASVGSTRLVVRERYRCNQGWARVLVEVLGLVSFVMSQKMLRGIRDRSTGAAR